MYPILWQWGWFSVPAFGVMVAAGFLAGSWVAGRYARSVGLPEDLMPAVTMRAIVGGLLGAKLLHIIVYWGQEPLWEALTSRYGFVFYGGLLGALAMISWYLVSQGLPWRVTMDALAMGVPVGQALGRVGCLLNGCCYGQCTDVWWGVRFPRESQAWFEQYEAGLIPGYQLWSLPVHPTQLYELVGVLAIWVVLVWCWPRRRFAGQIMLAYLGLYAVVRFVVEVYRGDPRGTWPVVGVSTSQGVALLILAMVAVLWYRWRRQPLEEASCAATPTPPSAG